MNSELTQFPGDACGGSSPSQREMNYIAEVAVGLRPPLPGDETKAHFWRKAQQRFEARRSARPLSSHVLILGRTALSDEFVDQDGDTWLVYEDSACDTCGEELCEETFVHIPTGHSYCRICLECHYDVRFVG